MALETETQYPIWHNDEKCPERNIHGLFYNPWNDQVTEFSGSFHHFKGGSHDGIKGILGDFNGRSKIMGVLSEGNSLSFNKSYQNRLPIRYKFSFDKGSGL